MKTNYSRRKIIAQSIAGGLTLASSPVFADTKDVIAAKAIHHEEDYHATPERIYETLLNPEKFQSFSGHAAQINREAGGGFSLFDAMIVGRNIEVVPSRRIVQAWRPTSWPKGTYSIVRFELQPQGAATRVILDHTGFPAEDADHLVSGWEEHYWAPLRKYLG